MPDYLSKHNGRIIVDSREESYQDEIDRLKEEINAQRLIIRNLSEKIKVLLTA